MKRRLAMFGLPLSLAACGLSERPYAVQRQWPLLVPRPQLLPPRAGGLVLEVRDMRAGAGLDRSGLQTLEPDGSIATAYYDQWAELPAQGVGDALMAWLAGSGWLVVTPGSRGTADLALESELSVLWIDDARHLALAGLAVTAIDLRTPSRGIVQQQSFNATAPVAVSTTASTVQAQCTALADTFGQIEKALAAFNE